MAEVSKRDREHIFESLRKGVVPERGVEAFAEGIDKPRSELRRQLALVESHEGNIKFLRGGYGAGKTFFARLALADAKAQNFATSFVVVSENDLHFYRFDEVYRKVVSELSTASSPRGALGDILDRWIGKVEDALIAGGADENAEDFDAQVTQRLEDELARLTHGNAPHDLVRVVQTIFSLKQAGRIAEAGALMSWLSGSDNVATQAKRLAGIKGDIGSSDALPYLRGILEIVKSAGYKGMVIVIDEVETILRMRGDLRGKSLNGLRQIADAAGSFPGLLWIFTGTPDFYDSRKGVAGLAPLHDRIQLMKTGRFASLRQPQLELVPFDAERLKSVALRLRELYPSISPTRRDQAVNNAFIERLVTDATAKFRGDVGVVPRQFLRALVNQLDLVEEHEEYDPMRDYAFTLADTSLLSPEENAVINPLPTLDEDELPPMIPLEDVF